MPLLSLCLGLHHSLSGFLLSMGLLLLLPVQYIADSDCLHLRPKFHNFIFLNTVSYTVCIIHVKCSKHVAKTIISCKLRSFITFCMKQVKVSITEEAPLKNCFFSSQDKDYLPV